MFIRRGFAVSAAVATAIAAFSPSLHADSHSIAEFAIPAQPLSTALIDLSKQANIQILTAGSAVDGVLAPAVSGRFTLEAALHRLLKDGEFEYRFVDKNTLVLSPKKAQAAATLMRTAQLVEGSEASASSVAQPGASDSASSADASAERRVMLEEVIVTGSHIRGAQNLSSPVITFDRNAIERSGYATTEQFLQVLTQNLNDVAESARYSGGQPFPGEGAGVNLRGLGTASTLVLLNGRRLAPAAQGEYVDISMIPLSAIERIEVLTDGASAIYGSDAVAGVVNITLRKDLSGAETRLQYGSVTEGHHDEYSVGQSLGGSWESGRALVIYEYFRRTPLNRRDRDFASGGSEVSDFVLIPGQVRHSLFLTGSQDLSQHIELSGGAFYSRREGGQNYSIVPLAMDVLSEVEAEHRGGSLALRIALPRDWEVRADGLVDESKLGTVTHYLMPAGMPSQSDDAEYDSRVSSFDLASDGALGNLPGGVVRLAVGGHFRSEELTRTLSLVGPKLERDVLAAYAELLLPWVGTLNRRSGLELLEFTLAGRYEDYSDFGTTFDPKLGVAWSPIGGLKFRGTVGTSFKAPLLKDIDSQGWRVMAMPFSDASSMAMTLYAYGAGEGLRPEESTTWTLGFDLQPVNIPNLTATVTYYEIDFKNRISDPFGGSFGEALVDSRYESFVTRNPGAELVDKLIDAPYLFTDTGESITHFDAVVHGRVTNLARVRQRGSDFSVDYHLGSMVGDWHLNLGGTYLFDNVEKLLPTAPEAVRLNNVWLPVDLRVRGSIGYMRGPIAATASINYTDQYHDRRTASVAGPNQRPEVASWTTLDLNVRYDLGALLATTEKQNVVVALSVHNLFDRDPPYVSTVSDTVQFDGVNASPRGRFVNLGLSVKW